MGARISQTNVYAISTVVATLEDEVENLLRAFESRRPRYVKLEVNGQLVEWVPHYANPKDPDFMITLEQPVEEGEEEGEGELRGAAANSTQISVEGGAGGGGEEVSVTSGSAGEGFLGGAGSLAGMTVSPLPSLFEGGEGEEDELVELGIKPAPSTLLAEGSISSQKTQLPASYMVSREVLQALLQRQNINKHDCELLDHIFSLVDTRGFAELDLREILGAFCLVVANEGISQFLTMLFRTFDRSESMAMSRTEMLRIFTLINETLFYFGDRPLDPRYVRDLVDSVFTTAGKVDGFVNWTDNIELIEQHPIVEMLFSMQFQGLAREKVFDEGTLEQIEVCAKFPVDFPTMV
jgi:hypothetical protein